MAHSERLMPSGMSGKSSVASSMRMNEESSAKQCPGRCGFGRSSTGPVGVSRRGERESATTSLHTKSSPILRVAESHTTSTGSPNHVPFTDQLKPPPPQERQHPQHKAPVVGVDPPSP